MAQLDSTSDHYPCLRAGMDAAFLWRWRFAGRYPDSDFHHEPGETADKVRPRRLKASIGQLARLLLHLSYVAPEAWPANRLAPYFPYCRFKRLSSACQTRCLVHWGHGKLIPCARIGQAELLPPIG
jgi:hypothetical protein